ncbi:MAG: response regulator [Nitrospiraceae bacterium]
MTDTQPFRSETILLVDDEPALRELVRVILMVDGYRVLEAGSGQEALQILESSPTPIHLLLTDVLMPGMDGQELAERARRRDPELNILLISGCPGKSDTYEWASRIGLAFLPKPFSVEDLTRTVRETLDGRCPIHKPCEPKVHETAPAWTIP